MKLNRLAGYLTQTDLAGRLVRCRLLLALGRHEEARAALIELLARATPRQEAGAVRRRRERLLTDAAAWLAGSFAAHGEKERGAACFTRLIAENPGCSALYGGMSRLIFPGDHYLAILAALHAALRPAFYVEIGVASGSSLGCVLASTQVAGVDPHPHIARRLPGNIAIFAETSDAFFAAYEERPQFAGRAIDFAFIDGLHLFEQALRDFINVERRAAPGGVIALHDCIPFGDVHAGRDFFPAHWVGDVWKCLAALLDHRPDLDIKVIGAPPSGLVVVRRLDPGSTVLESGFAALVERYRPLGFSDWQANYAPRLDIVPSRAGAVANLVGRNTRQAA